MATLGAMKSEIADDIDDTAGRSTSQIARAITRAIEHYQRERFWFNQSRDLVFDTVAGRREYDGADLTEIPTLVQIDAAYVTMPGDLTDAMSLWTARDMELINEGAVSTGRPMAYSYFGDKITLYPEPDAVYPVRLHALIRLPAPETNDEPGNPWMTVARDLILSRSELYLALHTLRDETLGRIAQAQEQDALAALRRETSKKLATGRIRPTQW